MEKNRYVGISQEELYEWVTAEKIRAAAIAENLRKAEKYFTEIVDRSEEILMENGPEEIACWERKKAKALELFDRNDELIWMPPAHLNPLLSEKTDQIYSENYYKNIRRFRVFCDETSINIGMPMLPKKMLRTIRNGNGIYQDYRNSLEMYMTNALMQSNKIISGFLNKNPELAWRKRYEFYYVYEESSVPIDTDSHDTKKVIDAISGLFITGDTGTTTSLYEKTFISKRIGSGTYIRILPEEMPVTIKETIEKTWEKHSQPE